MGKREKPFSEIIKGLNHCDFDFNPDRYLDKLVAEFRRDHPRCCAWCLLDAIYMSNSGELIPFFADLLKNFRNWYEIETAIDWLFRQNTSETRRLIEEILPQYLCHNERDIRDAAIRGIRNLDTNEALMLLWETRNKCKFPSEEETTEFQLAIDFSLAGSPEKRSFHIVP